MKLVLVAMSLLAASIGANATSLHPKTFTRVSQVTSVLSNGKAVSIQNGEISYDTVKKEVSFTLRLNGTCGFSDCSNLDKTVTLQNAKVEPSSCGLRVTAEVDRRPVDGAYQKLELVDYSDGTAVCDIMIPQGKEVRLTYTQQIVSRVDGGQKNSVTNIYGSASKTWGEVHLGKPGQGESTAR